MGFITKLALTVLGTAIVFLIISHPIEFARKEEPLRMEGLDLPRGTYESTRTGHYFRVEILDHEKYQLCDKSKCVEGKFTTAAASNRDLILRDFYASDIGQAVERDSHGYVMTDANYQEFVAWRKKDGGQYDDIAFDIGPCDGGVVCVALGDKENGIRFVRKNTAVKISK